jgi:DNA-binding transcriptional ArsR family regulator
MNAQASVLYAQNEAAKQAAGMALTLSDHAREAGDLLKAMAHEGRLIILCLLSERERSVTELETILELRQPAVSQQLARLRADNLVSTRREGKLIYYSLASNTARELVVTLDRLFRKAG